MSWKTLTERGHCEWNLNEVHPCDKDVWRSPCLQLASYLKGSPLVGMMLLHLHVNLNADDDDESN